MSHHITKLVCNNPFLSIPEIRIHSTKLPFPTKLKV